MKQKSSFIKAPKQPTTEQELTMEEQGNYVAIDCEFVGVGIGGAHSALARVSIVDWEANVLLDTFVQVPQPVTDYRTFVSGITPEDIQGDHAMTPEQCIALVKKILHDKIVIGHGLKSDFAALDLHHPWQLVRDTAKYEPFLKKNKQSSTSDNVTDNFFSALPKPRKLKDLAMTKLNREIQKEGQAHCSIEDAVAAMDLYKKARTKWEAVMTYKIAKTVEMENMLEYETP
jgi:RNA exonuclease 4